MGKPGSGRYTTYVAKASTRNRNLWDLFNGPSKDKGGVFYGSEYPTDSAKAAAEAVKTYQTELAATAANADVQMTFPGMLATDFQYGRAPNLADVSVAKKLGDPTNPYVPNLFSPGSLASEVDVNGGTPITNVVPITGKEIPTTDIKPLFVPATIPVFHGDGTPGNTGGSTLAPSLTSADIAKTSVGNELVAGQSKKS